jgi:hypothetical protein
MHKTTCHQTITRERLSESSLTRSQKLSLTVLLFGSRWNIQCSVHLIAIYISPTQDKKTFVIKIHGNWFFLYLLHYILKSFKKRNLRLIFNGMFIVMFRDFVYYIYCVTFYYLHLFYYQLSLVFIFLVLAKKRKK